MRGAMAAAFTGLQRLYHSLQDPDKVAAFQRLCGVRRPLEEEKKTDCHPNGVGNGTATERRGEEKQAQRRNSLTGEEGEQFVIRNRLLYYLFTFGTELGNELFYISFFPFWIWNVDPYVGRRVIIVWVWVMYLGQCTKDVIRLPRPLSPPVIKMEVFYNSEYGMPSTHAMSGTAIPLCLILLSLGRWQYPFVYGLLLAVSWCCLVCLSRIYMGMHSILVLWLPPTRDWTIKEKPHTDTLLSLFLLLLTPTDWFLVLQDVVVGVLYAIIILIVFLPALDLIDNFNLTYEYSPLIIISLHLALGIFSFTLDTWSTSRGDTAQVLGSGAGVACGSHVRYMLGLMPEPLPSSMPFTIPAITVNLLGMALLRVFIGLVILLPIRAFMKMVTIPLACKVFGIPCDDIRKARQSMQVELPYRYLTYGVVGFSVMFFVPYTFTCLGLQ